MRQDLGNPALHDEEMWVVHVQLDGAEEVLHSVGLSLIVISDCTWYKLKEMKYN